MVCQLRMLAPNLRKRGLPPCLTPPMPALPHLPRFLVLFLALSCHWLQAAGYVPFTFTVASDGRPPLSREISAQVRHADGRVLSLPAFPSGGDSYCVRAMAYQKGDYTLLGVSELRDGKVAELKAALQGPATQSVTEALALDMVRVDASQTNRFVTDSGVPFYPLGMNLAWPAGERLSYYRNSFSALRAHGMNWTRIWFANWGGLNLDWTQDDLGDSPAPGELNERVAQTWDAIIEDATAKGIRVQMVFQHHGQYSAKVDSNWKDNPWNAANKGGFLKTPSDFFTDETARRLTRQKYRYIVARYGWSPAVMAWELFNEVYQTDAYLAGDIRAVADWHNEMADTLRAIDPYHHLVTTSLNDIRSPIWERMDFLQPHLYAANVIDSVRSFYPSLEGIRRPIFYGEVGDDAVLLPRPLLDSGAPIIASMWSSIMGDSEYPAQPWYPERLLNKERLANLSSFAGFISAFRLASRNGLKAFQPAVESEARVPHIIPAGQWWNRRPNGFVKVPSDGSINPDITSIPRAYVGADNAVTDGYPRNAVIQASFPKVAKLTLRLNDVGAWGSSLRVRVDGTEVLNAEWASNMKGDPKRPQQPASFCFVVQPGNHEIVIENPRGPDWFDFHSLDLGIEAPALAAVGRRSPDFVMLWVWHRTGLFGQEPPSSGKILIEDLPAGTWRATWWETATGKATPLPDFQHPGGRFSLATIALARDAAVVLEKLP